jgi:hypothetical protein
VHDALDYAVVEVDVFDCGAADVGADALEADIDVDFNFGFA